jgi:citrate lyase subunit beta/citryl-CoA lyase
MPGSNARALEKAKSLAADGLIFDLEDAVAPAAKDEARDRVARAVREGGYGGREIIVRVNALNTEWAVNDLAATAASGPDAILLPKVNGAAPVNQALTILDEADGPSQPALWCMMETPLAMLHAEEIAAASPRIACLVMGTSDLAKDLHARHTPDRGAFLTSMGLCLLAARAHGLAILDGVHLDLDDADGFREQCRHGADLGFDGKTLIHPKTIADANEIFAPSAADVSEAHRTIAAYENAVREGRGVAVLDGRLVETLHVENARRVVATAGAIEGLDSAAATP